MVNTRTLAAIFSMALMASSGYGQQDQGGYITPGDSLLRMLPTERIVYLPQDGFEFYDVPNGAFKGKILPGPPLDLRTIDPNIDTLMTSTIVGASIRPQLLPLDTYFKTSDEKYHLPFYQQKEGYVFVLENGYQGWIALDEIMKKGYEIISWMTFFGASKGLMIHPAEKIIPVRMKPGEDAEIIETADELYSEITSTGKCKDSYCYVKVTQYRNPYDPSKSREENIVKKYKGWIQIIDENGRPLVAHNSQRE